MLYGYCNGQVIKQDTIEVSVFAPAFQYGVGVFETIKVTGGRPVWLEEHFLRMVQGAALLGIKHRPDLSEFCTAAARIADINELDQGSIKAILAMNRDDTDAGSGLFVITAARGSKYRQSMYQKGVSLVTVAAIRRSPCSPLSQIKSLNYTESLIAARRAREQGADEGLLLNTDGYVAEGTVSNIFWYDGKVLNTPAVTAGILPGITREKVINAARELSIPTREVLAAPAGLYRAQELFITNSLMGAMPVAALDGHLMPIGRVAGTLNERLWSDI